MSKIYFYCKSCGYESPKWLGKCPSCNQWNTFVEELKPAGTAGALKKCSKFLDQFFLLINGDTIFDINYHDLASTFHKDKLGHFALNFVNNTGRYGEVNTDGLNILSFEDELIDYLPKLSKLSSPIKTISKIFGINFEHQLYREHFFNFVEMKERRNLLVHRSGIADELYLKRFQILLHKPCMKKKQK